MTFTTLRQRALSGRLRGWGLGGALCTALALAGCGSDSSGLSIQGLATTGAAISNAKVSTRCAFWPLLNGSTDANGQFDLSFNATHAAPCLIR